MKLFLILLGALISSNAEGQSAECVFRFDKALKMLNNFNSCNQKQEIQNAFNIDLVYVLNNCPSYYAQNQEKVNQAKARIERLAVSLGCTNTKSSATSSMATPQNTQQQAQSILNTINQYKDNPIEFKNESAAAAPNLNDSAKKQLLENIKIESLKLDNFDENDINKLFGNDENKSHKEKETAKSKCSELEKGGNQNGTECIYDQNNNCVVNYNWQLNYIDNEEDAEGNCYNHFEFTGSVENSNSNLNVKNIEVTCRLQNGTTHKNSNWIDFDAAPGLFHLAVQQKSDKITTQQIYSKIGQAPQLSFYKSNVFKEKNPACISFPKAIDLKKYSFNVLNENGIEINLVLEPFEENYNPEFEGNYRYYTYATISNNNNYPVWLKGPNIKLTGWNAANNRQYSEDTYLFLGWFPSNFSKEGTKIEPKNYIITPKNLTNPIEYYCTKEPKIKSISWADGFVKK